MQKSFASFLQKRRPYFCLALLCAAAAPDHVATDLVQFARLLTPGQATPDDIGAFAAAHPTWPDQAKLHRRLADALVADPNPAEVLAACRRWKPAIDAALLRCATAEQQAGNPAQGLWLARQAWRAGITDPAAEAAFLAQYGAAVTPEEQWRRFDQLDWQGNEAAARQAARVDAAHRALAAARLALRHNDARALDVLPAVPAPQRADPVLVLYQARWLRAQNATAAALALWRAAGPVAEAAAAPDRRPAFWTERDRLARLLLDANDDEGACFLADDAVAGPDQAPDALFLAGWIALRRLHDPARAQAKFQALAALSPSIITQARAYYWQARASTDATQAAALYAKAAAWPTTFYGQLAVAQLAANAAIGPRILALHDPEPSAAAAQTFAASDLVRAAGLLAGWGDTDRAQVFLLRQGQLAPDTDTLTLVAQRAAALGLPAVSVAAARLAGRQGHVLRQTGWPAPYQPPAGVDAALALGLMRQESSFDPGVVSHSGAVGLMQLMPDTARQVGGQAAALRDPAENMRLGTLYLRSLLDQFSNVPAYAAAAYNAGPHRVRAWLHDHGDPADAANPAALNDAMIDWIELIPFAETRNYVQRVLENRTVYAVTRP